MILLNMNEPVAVEINVLSFLNGLPKAFVPHFTNCFRDSAFCKSVEDLIDEVSVLLDFAIEKNGSRYNTAPELMTSNLLLLGPSFQLADFCQDCCYPDGSA